MRFPAHRTAAVVLAVISGCFATAVVLLCLRRAMGALSRPLAGGTLALTLLGALLAAALVRVLWLSTWPGNAVVRWVPSVLLLLLAAALWVPGTSAAGAAVLCVAVGLDLCVAVVFPSASGGALRPWLAWLKTSAEQDTSDDFPPEVCQRFTRRRTPAGAEFVDGALRATFAAGQRTEHYHVAFCPPLDAAPHIVCRQREGPTARIKVAQVFAHGVRLELRLDEAAQQATEIVLQLSAHCERPPYQPRTQA